MASTRVSRPSSSSSSSSSSYLRIKEAVVITPSEPTPSRILPLSSLDSQLFLRFTIEYLLVYRPQSANNDQGATASRLKAALSRALVSYYPLAGRVRARPHDSCLEVLCRGQGALFVEAESDHSVSQFERAPTHVTTWRHLLSFSVSDVLKGAPPLVVQLTWLSDGAAALGVGISHCLCDGIGSADFLNHLAQLASPGFSEFKSKPVWDRHLLSHRHPSSASATHGSTKSRCTSGSSQSQRNSSAAAIHPEFDRVPDLYGFAHRFTPERLTPTSFTFARKSLNDLKKLTASSSSSRIIATSFEVLSAHVWRSWVRALNLPSKQIVKLLFSVNIRDRIRPRLPECYYGNGFVLGCAQTTADELARNELAYATSMVRKAKEKVNDDYVRNVVEAVSESRANADPVGVLIVSQWSRLGLDDVDFGMGKPVHVGPVCNDKYCLFLPVYGHRDAVKVMVAVPTCAVDNFQFLLSRPTS